MRSRLVWVVLGLVLGLGGFVAGCAAPQGAAIGQMSWWDRILWALGERNFLGYLIPLLIGVVGLFLKIRILRFAVLTFAIVYLGFVLGLRIGAMGGPAAFILFLNPSGVKNYMDLYLTWAVLIVLGVFVGRLFCGWVCPMGAIQQFLFRKDLAAKVPWRVHNGLRWLRFALLITIIVTVVMWRWLFWYNNDPFRALFLIKFPIEAITGTILLVAIFAGSLFVFVPFCKYLCPLGAILALFSKLSLWKVKVDEAKCTDCKRCYKVDCDYQAISPGTATAKPKVNQLECTSCGECIAKCPEAALKMTWFKSGKKEPKAAS